MRVLVCGGRDYTDREALYGALDQLHRQHGFRLVITGGALGADTLAVQWARARDIPTEIYKADWIGLGREAGPIRNKRMLREGRPDLVVAFPGGKGTANLVGQAREYGVEVLVWSSRS